MNPKILLLSGALSATVFMTSCDSKKVFTEKKVEFKVTEESDSSATKTAGYDYIPTDATVENLTLTLNCNNKDKPCEALVLQSKLPPHQPGCICKVLIITHMAGRDFRVTSPADKVDLVFEAKDLSANLANAMANRKFILKQ